MTPGVLSNGIPVHGPLGSLMFPSDAVAAPRDLLQTLNGYQDNFENQGQIVDRLKPVQSRLQAGAPGAVSGRAALGLAPRVWLATSIPGAIIPA